MTAPREYSISYGGITISTGTISGAKVRVHDFQSVRRSVLEGFEFRFQILIYDAPTRGDMASAANAIETAFEKPLGDLVVNIASGADSGTTLALRSSDNTALNVSGQVEKVGQDGDSGRSRIYQVTISGELPYDQVTPPDPGYEGLRAMEWQLEFNASRLGTLTITGEYTAQPGPPAVASKAQYDAQIGDLVTAVIGFTGLTFFATNDQPLREQTNTDRNDSVTEFERVYVEKAQTRSSSAIVNELMTVERSEEEHATSPQAGVIRPEEITVTYEASIDKNTTTDLKGQWSGSIFNRIVNVARGYSNANRLTVIRAAPSFDYFDNVIRASVSFIGTVGQRFLSLRIEVFTEVETGQIIAPTWPERDSAGLPELQPTPAYRFGSAKTITQRKTTTRETLGSRTAPTLLRSAGQITGAPVVQAGGSKTLVNTRRARRVEQRERGIRSLGQTLDVTDEVIEEDFTLIAAVPGAIGGGGGGTTTVAG